MTNRELLMKHILNHNAKVVLTSRHLVIWQYNDIITTDEFDDNGKAVSRICRKDWTPWLKKTNEKSVLKNIEI